MINKTTNKYLFFDANMYRSLFSESDEFSDEFLQFVQKLVTVAGVCFLIPQQVQDEVERNYLGEWFLDNQNTLNNKLRSLNLLTEKLDLEYKKYSNAAISKIKKEILKEKVEIIKKIEKSKMQFLSSKSKSRVKLNRLFKLAKVIDESEIIRNAAFHRREKGNPPIDGQKIGDKLIWESLLSYFVAKPKEKPTLIFVSRDNTAWKSRVTDRLEFDPWLQKEFKKISGGSVKLLSRLSDIPDLTKEEKEKIKEEEEKEYERNTILKLKTRIPDLLSNVNTFAEANKIMRAVETKVKLVDPEAIELILKASLENSTNSIGPYNQVVDASRAPTFFSILLQKSIESNWDIKIWKIFYLSLDKAGQERFYDLRKTLQDADVKFTLSEIEYIHADDVPF